MTRESLSTSGRYMVANIDRAREVGHGASIGYTDSLPEACEFAHIYGSASRPFGVFDSEQRRGDRGICAQLVHATHGSVTFLRSIA